MRTKAVALVALTLILLSACSSAGGGVKVDLAEFSIDTSVNHAAAGAVDFEVRNQGSVLHEFIVLKTKLSKLPTTDGVVRTEAKGIKVVKSVLRIKAGQLSKVSATLSAGRYTLICNIVGHYQSGMHTTFTVT